MHSRIFIHKIAYGMQNEYDIKLEQLFVCPHNKES